MQNVGTFIVAVLTVIIYNVLRGWFPNAGFVPLAFGAFALSMCALGGALDVIAKHKNKRAAEAAAAEGARRRRLVREVFGAHPNYAATLKRIHARTIYKDEFGDWVLDRWVAALNEFIVDKLAVSRDDASELRRMALEIRDVLAETSDDDNVCLPEPQSLTPRAFEEHCALVFRECGFETTVTGGTGDQGADVVATQGEVRIVVQCKLYRSTVGNDAVQQAAAARSFYDANVAMVVTTQGFTPSARQLARKTNVMLVDVATLKEVLTGQLGDNVV